MVERLPDLLLVDWNLPGLSGVALTRLFRKDRYTQDLPIIMLSGRAREADRVAGLKAGADDYVTKPFSLVELIARVEAVLRRTQ